MKRSHGGKKIFSGWLKKIIVCRAFAVDGWCAFVTAILFIASTGPALAYIDFGIGSMLVQLLLGGIAGGVVIVKFYWGQIKESFKKLFGSSPVEEETDARGKEDQD